MTNLKQWLAAASPAQKKRLAELANTSLAYISHIASGRRIASADTAQALVKAAKQIKLPGVSALKVEMICPACRACDYVKNRL
jgi:transcriptional regulator with XRE-family HTH domain